MKIEILGSGCPKCRLVEDVVKQVIKKLKIKVNLKHVYDINEIIERGVMTTPAIVIDGKVKISGRIPSEEEIEKLLKK